MNMKNFFELIANYDISTLLKAGIFEIHRKIWRELIKGSYSQNYEDLIIDKYFGKKIGSYVEIGAYHPTRLSNTYLFYKKGWRGTVIEPNPEVRNKFTEIRSGDKFLSIGVADKNNYLKYYKFLIPALNTFSKKNINKNHKIIGVENVEIKNVKDVINKYYDYLSIDTEGFDKLILKNWPWKICKPKIICVEGETKSILTKIGYRVFAKTKDNTIFVFEK